MRHPQIRDVCDIGQMLFWKKKWAFYATAVMFVLNSKPTPLLGLESLDQLHKNAAAARASLSHATFYFHCIQLTLVRCLYHGLALFGRG